MKKEFKVGDKVVMKGKIETIGTAGEYVVGVRWKKDVCLKYYLLDGKFNHTDAEPTIFHENQERVVQVRHREYDDWTKRVFVMKKNGKFLCWDGCETIEEAKKENCISSWNFMREIPEKRVITMQEIAEKFNIDVELIEIYL